MVLLLILLVWFGSLALFVGLRVKATRATARSRLARGIGTRAEGAQSSYRHGRTVPLRF
jgi:hypothetical protein